MAKQTKTPKPAAKGRTSSRKVGQTTKPKQIKSAASKPQARARTAADRAIEGAAPPWNRGTFDALARPSWARFEAFQSEDGTEAEIDVYDVIGSYELNAARFRQQLKGIRANRITLNINSPGGSVFDAFAMYEDLRAHPAHIHVRVRGIAASAASLLAMAGDSVEIAENGFLMIHNAWVLSMGDKREMANAAKVLGQIDKRLAVTYAEAAARDGRDVEEPADAAGFAALMDDETWFDSADALAAGLVDSVGSAEPANAFAGLDVSHFAKCPGVVSRQSRAKPTAEAKAPAKGTDAAVAEAMRRLIATLKG